MSPQPPEPDGQWLALRRRQEQELAAFESRVERGKVEFSRQVEQTRQKLLIEQQKREQEFWRSKKSIRGDDPQHGAASTTAPSQQATRVTLPVTPLQGQRNAASGTDAVHARGIAKAERKTPTVKASTTHAKSAFKPTSTPTKPTSRHKQPAPEFINLCSDDEDDIIEVLPKGMPATPGSVPTKPAQPVRQQNDDDDVFGPTDGEALAISKAKLRLSGARTQKDAGLLAGNEGQRGEEFIIPAEAAIFPSPVPRRVGYEAGTSSPRDADTPAGPSGTCRASACGVDDTPAPGTSSPMADASQNVASRSSSKYERLETGAVDEGKGYPSGGKEEYVRIKDSMAAPAFPLTSKRPQGKMAPPPSRQAQRGSAVPQSASPSVSAGLPIPKTASSMSCFKKPSQPVSATTPSKNPGLASPTNLVSELLPAGTSTTDRTLHASPRTPSKRKKVIDLSSEEEDLSVPSNKDQDDEYELPVAKKARLPPPSVPAAPRLKTGCKASPKAAQTRPKPNHSQASASKAPSQKPPTTPTTPTAARSTDRRAKLQARQRTQPHLARLPSPFAPHARPTTPIHDADLRTRLRSLSLSRTPTPRDADSHAPGDPKPSTKATASWIAWTRSRAGGDRHVMKQQQQQQQKKQKKQKKGKKDKQSSGTKGKDEEGDAMLA